MPNAFASSPASYSQDLINSLSKTTVQQVVELPRALNEVAPASARWNTTSEGTASKAAGLGVQIYSSVNTYAYIVEYLEIFVGTIPAPLRLRTVTGSYSEDFTLYDTNSKRLDFGKNGLYFSPFQGDLYLFNMSGSSLDMALFCGYWEIRP